MTRSLFPLHAKDISSFAKSLKSLLDTRHAAGKPPPSHLELLNLLARANGLRNYQTLRAMAGPGAASANALPAAPADAVEAPAAEALSPTARRALQQFDASGRLVRLPTKLSVQQMCSWALWTHFAARRIYTEKEVNRILNAHHTFGDQATLRRELVNMKLLGRKSDCSAYWKEPRRPDDEVKAFLKSLRAARDIP